MCGLGAWCLVYGLGAFVDYDNFDYCDHFGQNTPSSSYHHITIIHQVSKAGQTYKGETGHANGTSQGNKFTENEQNLAYGHHIMEARTADDERGDNDCGDDNGDDGEDGDALVSPEIGD